MPLDAWLILAFLLGAAIGALLVSMQHYSNLSRIREQFQAELDSLVEAKMDAASARVGPSTRPDGAPGRAA
jgi:hypothetical protein